MSRERKLPAVPAISSKVPREIAQVLGPLKQIVEALQQGGIVSASSTAAGGSSGSGSALPEVVVEALIDSTIPPAPTGVAVQGGMALIIVSFDKPGYRNHAYTEVWRADSNDFSLAVLVGTTQSTVYTDSVGGSRVAWYWLRHVSTSTPPRIGPFNSQTGTRGETGMDATYLQQVLAGKITENQLALASVNVGQIIAGAVDITKFASGIRPTRVVAALPVLPAAGWQNGDTAALTTDGKLYRIVGGAWRKDVDAADIAGQVTNAQIAGLAASKVTGQLTDAQIAAVSAAKLTGQITAAQIADGSISGTKFASGIQPVAVVSSLPAVAGYTGPRVVFLTTDSKMYRYTGSAWVSTVPTSDIAGTLADAQIAGLAASKVTGQLSDAQIAAVAAAKLTGQLAGTQLADGAITAAKIAAGVIDQSKLAADMEVPKQVGALPTTYQGTDLLVLTTDRKLYRWNGAAYVSTTAAADITGQLAASQVAALEASKITGQLTDSQLAGISAAKLAGQIVAPQIAEGAISPSKMLAVPEGFALNLDPGFVDPAAWRSHYNDDITDGFVTVADGKRGNRVYRHGTGRDWNYNRQPIPVVVGEAYRFSAWMRKSPDATSPFYFVWAKYNADGVYQTYSYSNRVVGTEWTFVEMLLTADAPFIAPGFALNHNGTAGYGEIQDFRFEAQLSSGLVADGAILATKIADNAITTPKLAAGAVVAGKIAANAVGASEVAAGAITTNKLAAGAVTANEIAAGAITGNKIAAATITGGHIAAKAITASQIAAGAVTATELAAGSVTTAKLAAGSVDALSIAAGAVVADKIAANAVTADKLAANAVVAGKVAAGAISASEIAANAITTEKLVVAAGNLVPNSDFATGDFTNWRPWAGIANMAVLPAADPSVPPGAPARYLARFSLSASAVSVFTHVRAHSDSGAETDGISVAPGEMYRVSIAAARSADAIGVAMQVIVYYRRADGSVGSQNQMIPTQSLSSTWQTFGGEFTVPANCVRAYLYVYNGGAASSSGAIYWTNLRCSRMASADLIVDGAITAAKVAAGAITTTKLAASAVTANELAAGSVVAGKIAAGAVTATELAAGSVTTAKLAAGSVDALSIAAGAVVADKIAANAITADKLAANAVVAGKVAAGAISASEIAANAITSVHIAAGQVTTAKLAASAVTANELAAGSVVAGKIAAGAVTATELAAGAVTTAKLAAGSVDALSIAAGAVIAGKIAANAVTANELAANSITAAKISTGAITTGHIAAGQVTTEKIAAGSVTANELAAGSVIASKIAALAVQAQHIQAGAIVADKLAAGAVTAASIQAGEIRTVHFAPQSVTAEKIAAGSISADKLAVGSLSAVSANLGTVVAGRAQNFDGSNFVDFNAAGQMPFLKIGGNVSILANGEGYFSRRIISEPDIVASGVWSGNSGWIYPNGVGLIVIDTGMNTPGAWSDFPASVYEAAATISAGQQQGGGGTGYNYCRIVTGDGISSGGGGGYIDNRIYVLFLYFHFGAGPVLIEQIKWKVARI